MSDEPEKKKQKYFRKIGKFIIRAILGFNVAAFLLVAAEWCASWHPDRETRAYRAVLEKGEKPYWKEISEMLDAYLLPGEEVQVEDFSYDPYEVNITYDCWLLKDGKDMFSFLVSVKEPVEGWSEDCLYPIEGSDRKIVTDFVQKCYRSMLIACNEEYYQEQGHYVFVPAGASMSQDRRTVNNGCYYMGLVLSPIASGDTEGMEWLFREACERMEERQALIEGQMKTDIWIRESCAGAIKDYPVQRLDFSVSHEEKRREVFEALAENVLDYTELYGEEELAYYAKWLKPVEEETESTAEQEEMGWIVCHVRHGDCLWSIAEEFYGEGALWTEIYRDNREKIGADPDILMEGTQLYLKAERRKE